jgi:predicted transcriptional regulator
MTRKALSLSSGVSSETIAKIEKGATTDPAFSIVVALTDAMNLDLQDLVDLARSRIGGEPPRRSGEPP